MPRTYFRGPGQRVRDESPGSFRYHQPQFYDPYFFVQGSVPEKMVMKELVRRGIYFEHTPQTNDINWGYLKEVASSDPSKWEADFLFPQFKIWLEVQGAYFHTMPGIPEKEAMRFAIIEAAGWRPIYWWDYDIEARLIELMDSVPEFYRPPGHKNDDNAWAARNQGAVPPKGMKVKGHSPWHSKKARYSGVDYWGSHHNYPRSFGPTTRGLPFLEGGTGIDHLKGLRTANRNRARPPQITSKRRTTRKSKIAKKSR